MVFCLLMFTMIRRKIVIDGVALLPSVQESTSYVK